MDFEVIETCNQQELLNGLTDLNVKYAYRRDDDLVNQDKIEVAG
ncbi:MAG: hypothetical protein AB2992_05045 [Candidatus Symbiodolus clandestinus]